MGQLPSIECPNSSFFILYSFYITSYCTWGAYKLFIEQAHPYSFFNMTPYHKFVTFVTCNMLKNRIKVIIIIIINLKTKLQLLRRNTFQSICSAISIEFPTLLH